MAAKDAAWKYCERLSSGAIACNFCGSSFQGGGITRMNIKKCTACPQEVKEEIENAAREKRDKRQREVERKAVVRDRLFGKSTQHFPIDSDSSEDDMEYPPGMDDTREKKNYRRAMRESHQTAYEDAIFRGERGSQSMRWASEAGGSRPPRLSQRSQEDDVDVGARKKKKGNSMGLGAIGGMFGRQKDPKQRTIRNTFFGNAQERVGRTITNMFNAHGISANVADGPWLQEVVDVCANAGLGVKAPTPYEVREKYTPLQASKL